MKTENLTKMKKLEKQARQRILDRGKLEFRVEPELLSAILDLAKQRNMPVGPMIREWVSERLTLERKGSRSKTQLDVIERKLDELLAKYSDVESA